MKALILTNARTSKNDKELINKSNVLKIAVNCADYKADYRIFRDCCFLEDYVRNYQEKLITCNYKHPKIWLTFKQADEANTISQDELYFMGGTITCAIDFAIKQGCRDIMLVADNRVYSTDFKDCISRGISELKRHARIYKYSKKGNFDLRHKHLNKFV